MNSGSGPIGIFDSGIGGLTVASSVHDLLPREALLYYGDTLHMPYGEKSQKSIEQYSLRIAEHLLEQGAKALVIACNSASATASEAVRRLAGDSVPVIDVINPAVGALAEMKQDIRVGVIGTKAYLRDNRLTGRQVAGSQQNQRAVSLDGKAVHFAVGADPIGACVSARVGAKDESLVQLNGQTVGHLRMVTATTN